MLFSKNLAKEASRLWSVFILPQSLIQSSTLETVTRFMMSMSPLAGLTRETTLISCDLKSYTALCPWPKGQNANACQGKDILYCVYLAPGLMGGPAKGLFNITNGNNLPKCTTMFKWMYGYIQADGTALNTSNLNYLNSFRKYLSSIHW